MLEKLPEEYSLAELMSKTVERSPYILVCLQECERMNLLLAEINRSLKELDLGLRVGARRTINQTKQSVQLIIMCRMNFLTFCSSFSSMWKWFLYTQKNKVSTKRQGVN